MVNIMELKSVTQEVISITSGIERESLLKISAIIAVRNMEANIEEYYRSLKSMLDRLTKSYEVIFVDDASDDATYDKMVELVKSDGQIGRA